MGVGQELTNGLKEVDHVFSFMIKQKKSPHPPPPHINNDRPLTLLSWLNCKLGSDQGSTRLDCFSGFVPDILISKMKMGLENKVVYITEMTKALIMFLSSEQARWNESCVLIGFQSVSEQDGPLLLFHQTKMTHLSACANVKKCELIRGNKQSDMLHVPSGTKFP